MRHALSSSLLCALACAAAIGVIACVAEPAEDDEVRFSIRDIDRFEAPEEDGNLTAAQKTAQDDLAAELTRTHGQRPRRYNGLLNGNVEAERCFSGNIATVTQFINDRLAARGLDERVDEWELTTNFITEGGYFVLDGNQTTNIDGFNSLGVDTLVGNYRALKPYLHQTVQDAVEAGDRNKSSVNERGETVHSLTDLNIEEGMYANAGMFAWSRAIVAADMADPSGLRSWCRKSGKTPNTAITSTNLASLPQWEQFYWTTVYFNTGPGTGKKLLCSEWLPYARTAYRGAENSLSAKYNASWRTATYRFLAGTVSPTIASYCADKNGAACTCDRCNVNADCAACVGASGCGWCSDQSRCSASSTGCGTHVTDAAMCPAVMSLMPQPCDTAISCADCFNAGANCGWCNDGGGSCVDGVMGGPTSGSCSAWNFTFCPEAACGKASCTDCLGTAGCGWCSNKSVCGSMAEGGWPVMGSCSMWMGLGPSDIGTCASAGDGGGNAGCPAGTAVGPSGACEPAGACQTEGGSCTSYLNCCSDPGGAQFPECIAQSCALCRPDQRSLGAACDPSVEGMCCGIAVCSAMESPTDTHCCLASTLPCGGDDDCCGVMQCVGGGCACQPSGQPCVTSRECCGGSFCSAGRCS